MCRVCLQVLLEFVNEYIVGVYYVFFFFFFSSRRRHTRFDCDWSSDVCSSDLLKGLQVSPSPGVSTSVLHFATIITPDADPVKRRGMLAVMNQYFVDKNNEIGRASCRERV